MLILRSQRSVADAERKFWEHQGCSLTDQAKMRLGMSPLQSRSLKIITTSQHELIDVLFSRLIGAKHGVQLLLTLFLGRQVVSKSMIQEMLKVPTAYQTELDCFLTYHTGSVIKAGRSLRHKGSWSKQRKRMEAWHPPKDRRIGLAGEYRLKFHQFL